MPVKSRSRSQTASECKSRKIAKVMREFHSGRLRAKGGGVVKSRSRALAIAYSEAEARCGAKAKRKRPASTSKSYSGRRKGCACRCSDMRKR